MSFDDCIEHNDYTKYEDYIICMDDTGIIKENIPKMFLKLLQNREAYKYNLKINTKYRNSMQVIFWNIVIRYYNKVEFLNLDDDKVFILEEIDGENIGV